jgi:hypothetical protein
VPPRLASSTILTSPGCAQSPTPGHVPRSVCVWGPSLLAVFILISLPNLKPLRVRST